MLIRKNAQNLFAGVVFLLCTMSNFTRCERVDDSPSVETPTSNSTFVGSILGSVVSCLSTKSPNVESGSCVKNKFYQICERYLRDKLITTFSNEERSEMLQYQPVMSKVIRIMNKDSEGSWLDTKIFNQLRLLFDESYSDTEGRKKKNKGLGQILMIAAVSGVAVMVPLVFKVITAMAAKALIVGKVAMILSALLYFNKLSHHDHESIHETSIRRQAAMMQ